MGKKKPVPIAVDFETYYSDTVSIRIQGTYGYVQHPEFYAYLVSVYGEGIEYVGPVEDFDWSKLDGNQFIAHNVSFDELVFRRCQETGQIPRSCEPAEFFCTADLAVYLSAPRMLGRASVELLNKEMDKSTRSKLKGMTYQDAKAAGMEEELHNYALTDAVYCYEIWKKFEKHWPEHERRIAKLNRESGFRGVQVNVKYLDDCIRKLKKTRFEAEADIPWDWSENKTPTAATKLRAQCRADGISTPSSFAQDSKECMDWEDSNADKFPWIRAIRQWRRSNIHLQKFESVRSRLVDDSYMPYNIKYFGAHTGRFSGDNGFNMQNMLKDAYMDTRIRNCFVPRKGKIFYVVDYAQIEARILLYLVKDKKTLDKIRSGLSVYQAHAIDTMGWTGGDMKEEDPSAYKLAKARVLGLGYGCGYKKFVQVAYNQARLTIDEKESRKCVADYRLCNAKVVHHWAEHTKYLTWSCRGKDPTHQIELPSGRDLTYFNPRYIEDDTRAQTMRGGPFLKFWGGKLTENECQAIGRDIMCEHMVQLEDAGYPEVFHVHDELIFEVDEKCRDEQSQEINAIMSVAPEWLPDFPIGIEGHFTDRYTK